MRKNATDMFGAACGVAVACLCMTGLARAQSSPAYLSASPTATYRTAAAPHADEVNGFGASVDSKVLAGLSGGADVSAKMTLNGTVSNNHADDVVTGYNSISAGSFQGASGVPMVIQNTGNNVLIQNATIINVQFRP
ncbi:hypothetical protein [Dyella sp. 2RAB6]|uniref:hypothetical protein n=1 Tax=Dyella sp. 2RAB6 TaxID=3232992 RepID=UPI003F904322